jgi:hypothetical protein
MQDIIHKPEAADIIETRAPARLDRLPWGRFHTLVIAALGITWVLDGLEVTLAGSVAGALKASPILRFTDSDVGLSSSLYLAGAVSGALYSPPIPAPVRKRNRQKLARSHEKAVAAAATR